MPLPACAAVACHRCRPGSHRDLQDTIEGPSYQTSADRRPNATHPPYSRVTSSRWSFLKRGSYAQSNLSNVTSIPTETKFRNNRSTMPVASKPVVPQNDNVIHAIAGSGGGILSMALT